MLAESADEPPEGLFHERLCVVSDANTVSDDQFVKVPQKQFFERSPLMIGSTILTTFDDNAAVTYLASLVPGLPDVFKYVVMAGAVTGGGLNVIANSPNPSDQSILASRFGEAGISPLYLS